MIVQWFFVGVAERTAEEVSGGVRRLHPAAVDDKVKKPKKNNKGIIEVDTNGNVIMIDAPKYEYTQWGAAYYPLDAKDTHRYSHAIIRTEAEKRLVINDPNCIELVNAQDWSNVRTIYPELKKHWVDQPE